MFTKQLFWVALLVVSVNSQSVLKGIKASIKDGSGSRNIVINDLKDLAEAYELRIEDQRLPELTHDCLKNLDRLDTLVIKRCGLQNIHSDAFKSLTSLRILDLSRNKIENVDKVFIGLNVWRVNLSMNHLSLIGDDAFDNMPKLRVLELDNNRLTKINTNWFKGSPKVFRLQMDNNKITQIPKAAFKRMDTEAALDIWLMDNRIEKIHTMAFEGVKKLDTLWLTNNKISSITGEMFEDVVKIRSFYIDRNALRCIDDSALTHIAVEQFSIDRNPISCECLRVIKKWAKKSDVELSSASIGLGCLRDRIEELFEKQKQFYEDQLDRAERREDIK